MPRKLTIEEMRKIAESRNGKCLDEKYINNETKLSWQCKEGHKWMALPRSVKYGSWCLECSGKSPLTIEKMREIAKKNGGECISSKYINARTKLIWKCKKGHEWKSIPDVIKKGHWCPECSNCKRLTIEEMMEIARKRNGECLSDAYINGVTKLKWRCEKGHEWEATPISVKRGAWCDECGGSKRLTIEEIQKTAKERKGKCLSDIYVNNHHKLKWKCEKGHEWKSTPNSIRNGRWCPICCESSGENKIRKFLELNNVSYEPQKTFPDCKGIKRVLEFDFYLSNHNILIEYDGKQHFEPVNFGGCSYETAKKSYLELIKNDKIKDKYCVEKNIKLIRISYLEKNYEIILKELLTG